MPFEVPEALLQLLRSHREQQRRLRFERNTTGQAFGRTKTNFMGSVRRLFSRDGSVEAVAKGYVGAMSSWQDEIEEEHDAFLLEPCRSVASAR